MSKHNRRDFIAFITSSMALPLVFPSCVGESQAYKDLPFTPLNFSSLDDLVLSKGLSYKLLISDGDAISMKDTFGCNNDYTAFIPLNSEEAIMWVNHEYPDPLLISGHTGGPKTKEKVDKERYACGGSLIHIKKTVHGWALIKNSAYNRRITGETKIPLIADRKIAGSLMAEGTFANCAGGVTPWQSVLTCEENFQSFYGDRKREDSPRKKSRLQWDTFYDNPPEHYGWVVEVNPKTGESKKLTGLGRCAHECATCIRTDDGRVAVYTGDDKNDEFLYKFISQEKDSLEKGELFVANIEKGEWVSLDINKHKVLKEKFKDQTDVLIHVREAGQLLGATKLDRPEDIEIHPTTGDVFVTLTNNKPAKRYHGKILKISETKNDHGAMTFKATDFLLGGESFSCPDNMVFDKQGNLWLASDISGSAVGKGPYKKFKNNGLFFVPMKGKYAGEVFQVASAPVDAELTGLSFSQDGETLFVSVQHPGEESKSLDELTSHWPLGGLSRPKSSVVQITGELISKGINV